MFWSFSKIVKKHHVKLDGSHVIPTGLDNFVHYLLLYNFPDKMF